MKPFVIKSLLFAATLVIFSYMADYAITNGLKKTGDAIGYGYQEYSTWNDIVSSSINADVIINGTSRAYRHIDPLMIDSIFERQSYNIGMSGSAFNKQYVRYMTLEKYNKKPKYIIQQIDFFTLSIFDSDFDERFLPYLLDIDEHLVYEHLKWVKKYHLKLPMLRYFSQRQSILQGLLEFFNIKHYPVVRKKGFFDTEAFWDGSALSKTLQQDSIEAQKNPKAIELFDSYLDHCKQNNIKVIFVFSPQYYAVTEYTKDKEEVTGIYNYFAEKYDVPFLDYSKNPISYDTTYFYNALHMNKKGADAFSLKLVCDIDSLKQLNKI